MAIIVVLKFEYLQPGNVFCVTYLHCSDTEDIAWLQVLKFEYLYTTRQCLLCHLQCKILKFEYQYLMMLSAMQSASYNAKWYSNLSTCHQAMSSVVIYSTRHSNLRTCNQAMSSVSSTVQSSS